MALPLRCRPFVGPAQRNADSLRSRGESGDCGRCAGRIMRPASEPLAYSAESEAGQPLQERIYDTP